MSTEKNLTGYPSIDKPWLKYYKKGHNKIEVKDTFYNNFTKTVNSNPEGLAMIDYKTGEKIIYSDLLRKINDFAKGLKALGITSKKKVGVLGFNCFIDPIALLGTNKIGATIFFLNPDDGKNGIINNVESLDCVIVENVFCEMILEIKNVPIVIWGKCNTVLPSNCIRYSEFICKGREYEVSVVDYEENREALVIFSSGSTGAPKPIVHSDFSVNVAVNNILCSDFPIEENCFLIKAIPSHIGLGVITTLLTALIAGVPYIQIKGFPNPALDLLDETLDLITGFPKWLTDNEFNDDMGLMLFGAPIFAKYMLNNIEQIGDFSCLKGILLGGSKMTKEELEEMADVFGEKGLRIPICNGYGQNEMGGAVTLNTINYNKNGSAGYPVQSVNIRIVDRYTYKDVPYNTIGLILEKSDSEFLSYLNMPTKTKESRITLSDGTEWYNSTDLGYMDEDGFLFITGRTTRVVIKLDHKVSMDVIEEKIKGLEEVLDVAVVPFGNEGDVFAFICVSELMTESEINKLISSREVGLSIFEVPKNIQIVQKLPRMNNGKVDYQELGKRVEKL